MKKIIALFLSIMMVCCLFACSGETANKDSEQPEVQEEQQEEQTEQSEETEQTEATVYSESLPLGGSLPALPLEGKAIGSYTELDELGAFYFDGCSEIHVYADETCDTPYIAVYRWAKDGKTFEETVQVEADSRNFGIAQFTETSGITGGKSAFFCRHISDEESADNKFYYVNSVFFEDGEDIVEIDFLASSEEIRIGNTDTYLWVPTGYESLMTDDRTNHGVTFYGDYDISYDYPSIWIGKVDYSYEQLKWFWSGWEGEFPITEEKYAEYCAQDDWSEESEIEYYGAFNGEITYKNTEGKGSLYGIHFTDGWCDCEDAYFYAGEDLYEIWMKIPESVFTPRIGMSVLDSIHTKG